MRPAVPSPGPDQRSAVPLRNCHAVTVETDDSPTRWRFTPTVRGVTIAAVNPSRFDYDPPPWAARLAGAAAVALAQ